MLIYGTDYQGDLCDQGDLDGLKVGSCQLCNLDTRALTMYSCVEERVEAVEAGSHQTQLCRREGGGEGDGGSQTQEGCRN